MNSNIIDFKFTADNLVKAQKIIKNYPENRQRSAILALLDLAQRQIGYLSRPAIEYVAQFLDMPFIRAYEIATFYTMFNLQPVGRYHIQVCGTTPCWLRGSDQIMKTCEEKLAIKCGDLSSDKEFSLTEVECLGACVNAPIVQINDEYFEDLTPEIMAQLIEKMKNNQLIQRGSQVGRNGSAPK